MRKFRLLIILIIAACGVCLAPFLQMGGHVLFGRVYAQVVSSHPDNCWWCAREGFDLSDDSKVWAYLTAPVTVLNTTSNNKEDPLRFIYLLDAPDGKRVRSGDYKGYVYGQSVSVHVLETQGNWTKIEAYDMWNVLMEGWVRSSLIKTVEPSPLYGLVVDKQTQRMHVYGDGKKLSTLLVSTGLPEKAKPYNESAAGEYLIVSWTGPFMAKLLYCDLALRYNGGDLVHLVPGYKKADGTLDHRPFEPLLGYRASHGCIRVQRVPSEEGINMRWLWDNLKRNTKLIIWDDSDRPMFYPHEDMHLYYNPNGGKFFHTDQYCSSVKNQHLPLTLMYYGELREEPYSNLKICDTCAKDFPHPFTIDEYNKVRGFTREEAEEAQRAFESGLPYIPDEQDDVVVFVEPVFNTGFEDLGFE